jgi:type I restriction enzyme, S subunit
MSAPAESHRNSTEVYFGDVCSLRRESVHPSQKPDATYVGLEHIDSGNPRLSRSGLASEVNSSKSKFYVDDVLYGKLRPYLDKAVLAERDGICSTDILVFKSNDTALAEFLVFLVHSKGFLEHAIRTTRGVNHPRTSWDSLSKFKFSLPSLPHQCAIARILRTIQTAREARERELALERERKAALMQYLFTHGPSGSASKRTRFGLVPQAWDTTPLSECAYVQTGVAKGRRFGSAETIKLPYLRVANVKDGTLDLTEIKTMPIKISEINRYSLIKGDVLMTEGGDFDKLGRGFIWSGQIEGCVHQNHIFAVRTNRNVLLPEYFAFLIQSSYGKAYFLSVAHRTTNLACINSTKLKAFPVIVPKLAEQKLIVEALNSVDANLETLERESALLKELSSAILEELMTGQLSAVPLIQSEAAA